MLEKRIKQLASNLLSEIVNIRRHLHMYPELSFQEFATSNYIKYILKEWGIPFYDKIADTGIVVVLEGKNPTKRCIALRADFDALPIQEENKVVYSSKNDGIMHACGHDAHTASLLGTIKILDAIKSDWEGTIKCIFQPAEERLPGGAKQMIEEGVLSSPMVDNMLGQHVFPDLEVGKVGFRPGIYMASTDELYIKVKGKGGHAALPSKNINPIVIASRLVSKLYSLFDKEQNSQSVFSIGFINGNGSTNIVPETVSMMGTFRSLDDDWRIKTHNKLLLIADDVAKEFKADIDFEIKKGYPTLENDIFVTQESIKLAKEFLGDENVVNLDIRMTAEDFAYYTKKIPCCFYRLGTANKQKGIVNGLHTSKFDIDEGSLEIGMGLMAYLAVNGFN
tara:strand:+ start:39704 stop:40882 length:1179 start_codon:yes stop_codon:yes gene_type:complete